MTTDSLQALTNQVVAFREERDWRQFHNAKDLALSLSLEASELLEIFQWQQCAAIAETAERRKADVADELADVMCYALLLSHELGIDLGAAVEAKLKANAQRYPVDEFRGSSRKA